MPACTMHSKKITRYNLYLFFDRNILDELPDKTDRRVEFIHLALQNIQQQLRKTGTTLDVRYGKPEEVYKKYFRITGLKKYSLIMITNLMLGNGMRLRQNSLLITVFLSYVQRPGDIGKG